MWQLRMTVVMEMVFLLPTETTMLKFASKNFFGKQSKQQLANNHDDGSSTYRAGL
jgi:hypothetical protein